MKITNTKKNNRAKKIFLFIIKIFFCFLSSACAQNILPTIKSNIKHINYWVENKKKDWIISPEISPDRLVLFCQGRKIFVKFKTDIDSIAFLIGNKDTVRFNILLNNQKKALTEIVGINEIPNTINDNSKIYYLSLFWSEAKYNFINIDKLNFNLDSLYKIYIQRVLKTKNDYEYYKELQRFAATLKDGHTQVTDNSQFYMFKDYIGLNFLDFDRKIYIVSLRKNIGYDSTYLGAELIEVSGMPLEKFLTDSVFPYISASTPQHLWMQGVALLHSGFKTKYFTGKVKKNNGEVVAIKLPYNGEETRTDNTEYWGRIPYWPNKILEFKLSDDSIAYLGLHGFFDEVVADYDECIDKINKAKAVIIDLRYNGGGSTEVAWHVQSSLTKDKYFLNFGWQTRINNGVGKANGNWMVEYKDFYNNCAIEYSEPDTIYVPDTVKRINVPCIILIGRYTFSAAEDFLINLYEVKNRPLYIGEPTGGSTGSPLVLPDFPGNGYARICTRRVCFPYSGKPFFGEGIIPDIKIYSSLSDYLAGRDVTLEKAINILRNYKENR